MKLGEVCETCALRDAPMVRSPPRPRGDDVVAVLGEAPGGQEVAEGRNFVGLSGKELDVALAQHRPHYNLFVLNTVLCQPPANDLRRVRMRAKKLGLVDPVKACAGRLREELSGITSILSLGKTALEAVTGHPASILDKRGFPMKVGEVKIMPTVHPAFVLRSKRWTHVFRSDVAKAFRHFTGRLSFQMPPYFDHADWDLLSKEFAQAPYLVVDVETDGLEPLACNLRCVGIGIPGKFIYVHPVRSVTGIELEGEIRKQIIRRALEAKLIVGHNLRYFDRMVLERHYNVKIRSSEDTIALHHCTESELPHSLGFLGSVHTDISSWKAEHGGIDYKTDEELYKYNAQDVAVTEMIRGPLKTDLQLKDQAGPLAIDYRLQDLCVDLHRVGMCVDQAAINRHAEAFREKEAKALAFLQRAAAAYGMAEFNPGSYLQTGDLMFDKMGLPYSQAYETESGGRGTGMKVIRALLVGDDRMPDDRSILEYLHKYRRARKFRSTFVDTLQVLADGRVHANFNAHATVSGRLSGSDPNLQQVPQDLRDIFVAGPGHALVAADMDQIELRMCAGLSGAKNYISVFEKGEDPHALTSDLIYGVAWRDQDTAQKARLRDFAKRFVYACLYGATDKTILEVMRAVEGKDGGFPYLNTTIGSVIKNHRAWLGQNPEFVEWWDKTTQSWRERGYIKDCIQGRKRLFLDGFDRNAMVNFPVQAAAAGVVHHATFELIDGGVGFEFEGPGTGIVYQGHDQLVIECLESSVERVKDAMKQAMNRTYPEIPVAFTSKAKAGKSWKDLK